MYKTEKMLPVSLPIYIRRLLFCVVAMGLIMILMAFATGDSSPKTMNLMSSTTEEQQAQFVPYPCYMEPVEDKIPGDLTRLEDVLRSDVKPLPGRSIFFHETKCHSPLNPHIMNLTARQACSIESAALHNPNFRVFVLFASPTYLPKDVARELPLIKALQGYKNVHLRQLNIWRYARHTPVEDWVNKGELFKSSYLTEHTSDLLRLMSLYRFGGIYMDIDVVVLRSLEQLPLNYVAAQEPEVLCNAVISLEPTGRGHEIAKIFLRDFQQNYNGRLYVNNGPSLIGRVTRKICGKNSIQEIVASNKSCDGFQVFNSTAFFPIPWQAWRLFFDPKSLNQTLAKTKDSYLVHIWNKVSYNTRFKVGTDSAYGRFASQNCPKVYAAAGDNF